MKTQIRRSIKHALLVEADDLISLVKFLNSRYANLKITAECNDDSEIESEAVDEIINFENPNYRKIKNLDIKAHSSLDERLSIRIRSGWPLTGTTVNVTSENDESAVYTSQQTVKLLSNMKPGYDLLARTSITFLVLGVWGVYGVLRTVGVALGIVKPLSPMPPDWSWIETLNIWFVFMAVIVGVLLLLDRLRLALFPKIFFMIGKQKRKMEALIKWRWIVFSGLILSILSSVAAGLILQKLAP
ncbi:MAG: hypothetical protein ACXWID_04070 [Pyrinomonadaceae bacterium]